MSNFSDKEDRALVQFALKQEGAQKGHMSWENGCPCLLCYGVGEDEEIIHTAEDEEYAFMDSVMRIRPGCHRRVVRFHVLDGDTATRSNCQRF